MELSELTFFFIFLLLLTTHVTPIDDCKTEGGLCFQLGCSDNGCDVVFKIRKVKSPGGTTQVYEITLNGTLGPSEDAYSAVGFSKDDKMGDDGVIACIPSDKGIAKKFINIGRENKMIKDDDGITLKSSLKEKGRLTCVIHMEPKLKFNELEIDIEKELYFVLLAAGPKDGKDGIGYHLQKIALSNNSIGFNLSSGSNKTDTKPPTSTEKPIEKEPEADCKTKGVHCFNLPSNECKDFSGQCDVSFKIRRVETPKHSTDKWYEITLNGSNPGGDTYSAVGFSKDRKMGDDGVITCISSKNGTVKKSLNVGYENKKSLENEGIILKSLTMENDRLTCVIHMRPTLKFNELGVDIEKELYFVLLAIGKTHGGDIIQHVNRIAYGSGDKGFNLSSEIDQILEESNKETFIHVHGSLMIIVYFVIIPTAILIGRFFKETWFHLFILKKRLWFTAHGGSMILSLIIGLIAPIFPFIRNNYEWPTNPQGSIHGIIGGVSIGLIAIQCGFIWFPPTNEFLRKIFYLGHIFIGVTAFSLGVLNIGLTPHWKLSPCDEKYLVVAFVCVFLSFFIGFSTIVTYFDYSGSKGWVTYDEFPRALTFPLQKVLDDEAPGGGLRKTLLLIFIIFCTVITAVMINILVKNKLTGQYCDLDF